jgi:hypothetical protein
MAINVKILSVRSVRFSDQGTECGAAIVFKNLSAVSAISAGQNIFVRLVRFSDQGTECGDAIVFKKYICGRFTLIR